MQNLRVLSAASCAMLAACAGVLAAAPRVEKVEPPNWWVDSARNPFQLLLTGSELGGAQITADPMFRVEVRSASADGRYLFLYLTIPPHARPGKYRFSVRAANGTAAFDFILDPPLQTAGRFRGFGPDDVIYLLMPDRFSDGDPANDRLPGLPAPDRTAVAAYHGGDFCGIENHLDYLKDLGITGIWLTPVYRNSNISASPYHGYHAVDFYSVEPHFGSMPDLQRLVAAARRRDIKIMLDQVPNHTGPAHPWLNAPPTKTWYHDFDVTPHRPNNDMAALTDPYARPARHEPPLRAWFNGRLPDLDQSDPLVRDYLIQNALWWIGETGADGFRIDTFARVDRPFWQEWNGAIHRQFPHFFTVGEVAGFKTPAQMAFFQGGAKHYGIDTGLNGELDFQLERAMRAVFAQNEPMTELADILSQDFVYTRPDLLVPFLDNHDQVRFLSLPGTDLGRMEIAETFLLTTRGIPHLYYGDEVGMGLDAKEAGRDAGRADFPGGFPGDPVNAFRPEGRKGNAAAAYDFLRRLLHFRQVHPALRGGRLTQLIVEENRYVYYRAAINDRVLVALDRSAEARPIVLDVRDLHVPDGTRFHSWQATGVEAAVSQGKLTIPPAGAIQILWAENSEPK